MIYFAKGWIRLTASILMLFVTTLSAQEALEGSAPWDYRDSRFAHDLQTVEKHHFNLNVQSLTKGQSSSDLGGDLEFILRYFPNHHKALDAMGRLSRRQARGTILSDGKVQRRDAAVFFERAVKFAPDDGIVRMLYGIHLQLTKAGSKARLHYEAALELEPAAPEVHYNAGLFYLDIDETELALEHARRAYENGYPLPGLRNKLQLAGIWQDTY